MTQAYKFEFTMDEPGIILSMLCSYSMVMTNLEMWRVRLDEKGEIIDDETVEAE
jgi:hypothetical protein